MTVTTTQKIIKIGTSRGITIPTRDLNALGADVGDKLKITIEPIATKDDIVADYEAFKAEYGDALKRLANR